MSKPTNKTSAAEAVAFKEKEYKTCDIIRTGNQIIIPDGMSYKAARDWLTRQEEAEEKTVSIHTTLECFPFDGAIALRKAIERRYGFAALADTPTWFGPKPPRLVQVETFDGKQETAPFGRMQPPRYEGGYIEASISMQSIVISGTVKKKHEAEVKEIISLAKTIIETESIYRGTAFHVDLSYLEDPDSYDPDAHKPVWMRVGGLDDDVLILNRDTLAALKINVFTLIEMTDACRKNSIPLKHGCILAGPYGTGKTLTAKVTAAKAVRNGWTFFYLKSTAFIAQALKMAEQYAPAVVFTEDIDEVTSGGRNQDLNTILNTLDGVDTKDKPIITIITTNHVENINAALLRPGRMDTVVQFTLPDAESAIKFVHLYGVDDDGHSLVVPMTEKEKLEVGESLAGFTSAFIAEAVQKAKRLAISEFGEDIRGKVTFHHLIDAANVLRSHKALMEPKGESPEKVVCNALALVNKVR